MNQVYQLMTPYMRHPTTMMTTMMAQSDVLYTVMYEWNGWKISNTPVTPHWQKCSHQFYTF